MSEETSFEDIGDKTSASDSSCLEAEDEEFISKKHSRDSCRSESDIETSTLDFNLVYSETDSSTSSFCKELLEEESEAECEETGDESKSFNEAKQTFSASDKHQQLAIEDLTSDSEYELSSSSSDDESIEDEFEVIHVEIGRESKSFNDTKQTISDSDKHQQLAIECLAADSELEDGELEDSAAENSDDSEADSSISNFDKKSIENQLEIENESKSFNDTKQTISASDESQQLAIECSTSCTSVLGKEFIEGAFGDEKDRIKTESFDADPNRTASADSPMLEIGALKTESHASDLEAVIKEPIDEINVSSVEQDGTSDEFGSVSNEKLNATSDKKQSFSPTEAMKALRISEKPSSESKATPRQSRFRTKTFSIFDSPYNTRLKARMIREKEMRSRSEGKQTDE